MTHDESCEHKQFINPHFTEAGRAVATAKLEEFMHQCDRLSGLVSTCEVDLLDAADCMHEIAWANDLYKIYGMEEVVRLIANAFDGEGLPYAGWAPDQKMWDNAVVKVDTRPTFDASKGAPDSTVDAFMYSLRNGVCALSNNVTLRRLSIMNVDQVANCAIALTKRNPPWQMEEIRKILTAWERLRS